MKKYFLYSLMIMFAMGLGDVHAQVTNVDLRSYCGPNCLTVFLKMNDISAELSEICQLAEKDAVGTSLYGLKKAAEAKGLYTKAIKINSVDTLDRLGYPAIVLLEPKKEDGVGHYVLALGCQGDDLKVVDPPYIPYIISKKSMDKKIEGSVLLLSTSPVELAYKPQRMILKVSLAVAAGILLLFVVSLRKRCENND